jgi:hypothetical protein
MKLLLKKENRKKKIVRNEEEAAFVETTACQGSQEMSGYANDPSMNTSRS